MIGFSEMMLVLVFATLVIGPERLPGVLKSWVRTLASWRAELSGVSTQLAKELNLTDLQRELDEVRAELVALRSVPRQLSDQVAQALEAGEGTSASAPPGTEPAPADAAPGEMPPGDDTSRRPGLA